jgi:hypothetical protein
MTNRFFIYDIETYPNIFTIAVKEYGTESVWFYEVSTRKNDTDLIMQLLQYIEHVKGRMVGFNNLAFDYPVIHDCFLKRKASEVTNANIMAKVDYLFDPTTEFKTIRAWDVVIPQVDIFKIHHFDNQAKSTSLKALELAMRMDKIQDLPFEPNTMLTDDEMTQLMIYNGHDVRATELAFEGTIEMVQFRDQMSEQYGIDFTNFNDVKVGTEILRLEIEKRNPNSTKLKSPRSQIVLKDLVLPSVNLTRPEFVAVVERIKNTTISEKLLGEGDLTTKGIFKDLSATIDGFQMDFGMGGLHGSVSAQVVTTDDEYTLIDLDVASYYPNLATANNIFPEHLGIHFCEVYKEMYEIRKKYAKGTPLNMAMKLALNGSFGATNSKYSYLFDPNYTFTITINGQLLLAMFIEQCLEIESLTMIQANTDGITVKLKRSDVPTLMLRARDWETFTGLVLEDVEYSRMFIRDCNNYIAETAGSGKLKRKGAYEYDTKWHQDPSSPVIAKCAEQCLVHGADPAVAVFNHPDIMDFMVRFKVKRSAKLVDSNGVRHQKITRALVTHSGVNMFRNSKPTGPLGAFKRKSKITDEFYKSVLAEVGDQWDERIHTKNKSVYGMTSTAMLSGRKVTVYNDILGPIDRNTIDFHYYITEVQKLIL